MKNNHRSELADNLGKILSYTVTEAILIKKMMKYFDPRPAELFKSKETEKIITRKISKLSKRFGGPPQIVTTAENHDIRQLSLSKNTAECHTAPCQVFDFRIRRINILK